MDSAGLDLRPSMTSSMDDANVVIKELKHVEAVEPHSIVVFVYLQEVWCFSVLSHLDGANHTD